MRVLILLFVLIITMPLTVLGATVATTDYVKANTENKVDTSSTANQTMAGTYTVSGTLIVPTPPLPSAP